MKPLKTIYWDIYVRGKFFGRYTTDKARIAGLKELHKRGKLNHRQIEIRLCFGNPGKI